MIGQRPSPTVRKYHHHGSGFQGSPVLASTSRLERSCLRTGPSPARISPRIAVGEMPRCVTLWRSIIDHTRDSSGKSGVPSYATIVAPSMSPPAMSQGPIIQPMSVNQNMTSPSCRSMQCAMSCAAFTGKPPCTCTAPFGWPVVPEV